jgi:hypothetical protein
MKNINYLNEMASANLFVLNHNTDADLMSFLWKMEDPTISHSERWSQIYDYMSEHYPEVTGSIITGLSYWVEEN